MPTVHRTRFLPGDLHQRPHPDPVELDDHQRVRRTQNPALVQFIYSADAAASFCRSPRLRFSFCAPSRTCDLMLMSWSLT